jgi:hypothetical protein
MQPRQNKKIHKHRNVKAHRYVKEISTQGHCLAGQHQGFSLPIFVDVLVVFAEHPHPLTMSMSLRQQER